MWQAPIVKSTEKASKKSSEKDTERKGKNVEALKEEPLDPVAEKLRQQRYVYIFLLDRAVCFSYTLFWAQIDCHLCWYMAVIVFPLCGTKFQDQLLNTTESLTS